MRSASAKRSSTRKRSQEQISDYPVGYFGAQKFFVPLEGGNDRLCITTAKRHHVDRREPQIGGDPRF